MKGMLTRYTFPDITVFMRTDDGNYLNLTDFVISEPENERLRFASDSKYILMFQSFLYHSYKNKNISLYVCDLDIDDLVKLAGIRDKSFLKRFTNSFKETDEQLLALFCARKIVNYRSGRITGDKEMVYSFYRIGYCMTNNKYKKEKNLVFKKKFYVA